MERNNRCKEDLYRFTPKRNLETPSFRTLICCHLDPTHPDKPPIVLLRLTEGTGFSLAHVRGVHLCHRRHRLNGVSTSPSHS